MPSLHAIPLIGTLGLLALAACAPATQPFSAPLAPNVQAVPAGPPTPTPAAGRTTIEPELTLEESKVRREAALANRPVTSQVCCGPQTAGQYVTLGGKLIRLPGDVYIASIVSHVTCIVGAPCPQTPIYILQHGESRIGISGPSGSITEEIYAAGDEGSFDFLKRALDPGATQ